MSSRIIVAKSIEELSYSFGKILAENVDRKKGSFSLALSGGNTPKFIFKYLAENFASSIEWNKIKFFWGDERCVPPNDNESNYKSAKDDLFDKLEVNPKNIFRIHGENKPEDESLNYSNIILENVEQENSLPRFDLIMLGLGEDGHTASIFPDKLDLFSSPNICTVAEHPATKQKRITLTSNVINNARKIIFIVSGESKKNMTDIILNKKNGYEKLPASLVNPTNGELIWLMDEKAAINFRQS